MTPWETLGVARDVPVPDLRRRYAALIKEFRPETHPQDFARIREAYEAALPIARQREAARFEAEEQLEVEAVAQESPGPAEVPYPPRQDVEVPDFEREIDTSDAPIAVRLEAAQPDSGADEPNLAARFHRFHELAGAAGGTRDEAFLAALRALLHARASASLDESQALEFALVRWFIESPQPPLTLLFEAGRTFDWHLHPARLSTWLSPWALRQMESRLSLSRDLVWARHFSGNAWLRRLHSPANTLAPVAMRPATLVALRWAERWQLACVDADTLSLAGALDPRTLRQIRGRELMSTDVLAGLGCACVAPGLGEAAIYAAIGTATTFALRLALQWIRPAAGRYRLPGPLARFVAGQQRLAALLAAGLAGLGIAMLMADDVGNGITAIAVLLISPAALLGVMAIWQVLTMIEALLAEAFAWRESVDRLEFDRCLRGRPPVDATAPFGQRWSLLARWKAIPEALRLQKVEVATRARPPRPRSITPTRVHWGKPSVSRMIWIGLWVLFAILRGIHAFGH